jgi:hypothetical protein
MPVTNCRFSVYVTGSKDIAKARRGFGDIDVAVIWQGKPPSARIIDKIKTNLANDLKLPDKQLDLAIISENDIYLPRNTFVRESLTKNNLILGEHHNYNLRLISVDRPRLSFAIAKLTTIKYLLLCESQSWKMPSTSHKLAKSVYRIYYTLITGLPCLRIDFNEVLSLTNNRDTNIAFLIARQAIIYETGLTRSDGLKISYWAAKTKWQ